MTPPWRTFHAEWQAMAKGGKGREGEGRGGEGEGKGRKEVALICTVKDTQCDRVLSKTRR